MVLVDEAGRDAGAMEKLQAHREGRRHRAVSVFVFNAQGEMLLQRRHPAKYHSGGLWSNASCTHPRPGESPEASAARRLREEMGVACALRFLFVHEYRAEFENGLIEDEVDHVFAGVCEEPPKPDPDEVCEWKWIAPQPLHADLAAHPERFTVWFRQMAERVMDATRPHPRG